MTDRAPRPEGMSDAALTKRIIADVRALVRNRGGSVVEQAWAVPVASLVVHAERLLSDADRLRADGATLKVRADEAFAAHSASFGALQTLSAALFDGEVDDYAALAEKIIARVKHAEGVVDCARNVVVSRWDGLSARDAEARVEKLREALAALDTQVHQLASAPKEPTP